MFRLSKTASHLYLSYLKGGIHSQQLQKTNKQHQNEVIDETAIRL